MQRIRILSEENVQWKSSIYCINCSLDCGEWANAVAWLYRTKRDLLSRFYEVQLLFVWHAVVYHLSRYRMWLATLAGLLGGHMLAVSVCLTVTQLAPEIRESRAETIVLYPLKWTTPPSVTPPAHQCTLQGSMELIIGHYFHKFTKIDSLKVEIVHILVIMTAVTQVHGNRQKSLHKAKITVIMSIVNSWFTYIPNYV